ncbi:MAG: lytic transglycosylase domain-containing protein, partial [Deltaproteobacteria bacterium]|nr:lytic transglycosylase domain-containing protein [Deltaproteobacteria bacterium]
STAGAGGDDGIGALFRGPSVRFDLPRPLLLAISQVESAMRPWTLNIAGRSFWYDDKGQALEAAGDALAEGKSVDFGLMQVNSSWLERYSISPEAALDPLANVYLGAWILRQEYSRLGDLKAAIGAYHSPRREKADRYARIVLAALAKGPAGDGGPRQPPGKKEGPPRPPRPDAAPTATGQGKAAPETDGDHRETDRPASPMTVAGPRKALAQQESMMPGPHLGTMKARLDATDKEQD